MSGFNPDYTPTRTIDPGIRGYADGALPGSWQLFNNTVNNVDVHVIDANFAGPSVGVQIFRQTATATHSPAYYYADSFITNGRVPHRIYGVLRGTTNVAPNPAGPYNGGTLNLVYNTRLSGDGFSSGPIIQMIVRTSYTAALTGLFFIVIETGGYGQTLSKINTTGNINGNSWYGAGIEVLGSTVNFYLDPVSQSDPDNLAGPSALELVYTHTLSNPKGMEGPAVFGGGGSAGAFGANDWSGVGDIILEELEGPTGGGGNTQPPGTGDQPPIIPPPTTFPWSFKFPDMAQDYPYIQFKAIRTLQNIYKNLVIGP